MSPPVTTLAVPIVSSTKPQKMPACISPARGSLNILVWMNAYSIRPTNRRGMSANGLGPSARTAAKTRRWRAIASTKNAAAPQNSGEHERVERDLGERLERAVILRRPRPVVVRSGQRLERVVEHALRWRRAIRARPSGCPAG